VEGGDAKTNALKGQLRCILNDKNSPNQFLNIAEVSIELTTVNVPLPKV
jgi:hypothetical protein